MWKKKSPSNRRQRIANVVGLDLYSKWNKGKQVNICLFFSQNHRMHEAWRDHWRSSGPTSLVKKGHLEQDAQHHVQMPFEISRDGDSTTTLGNLFQWLKLVSQWALQMWLKNNAGCSQGPKPLLKKSPILSYCYVLSYFICLDSCCECRCTQDPVT